MKQEDQVIPKFKPSGIQILFKWLVIGLIGWAIFWIAQCHSDDKTAPEVNAAATPAPAIPAQTVTDIESTSALHFGLGQKIEHKDRGIAADEYVQVQKGTAHYDEAQKKLAKMPKEAKRALNNERLSEILHKGIDEKTQKKYAVALDTLAQIKPSDGKLYYGLAQEQIGMIGNLRKWDMQETVAAKLDPASVTQVCRSAIRDKAQFYGNADFSVFAEHIERTGMMTRMGGQVDVKNAFGATVPYKFMCVFRGANLESAALLVN